MKLMSHAALAAVLATGFAATAVVAPAAAQKKGKEDAGPKRNLSNEFRKAYAPADTALAAKDYPTALAALNAAEAVAKSDDEKYIVSAQKVAVYAQTNDNAQMLPLLETLIANPKTPPADVAKYTYYRGALPFQAKKYKDAIPYLEKARALGFQNPDLPLQLAQSYVETGNVAGGVTEIDKAITAEEAAGRKAPQSWYDYAFARLYTTGQRADAAKWQLRTLKAYPSAANWRKSLLVYRDSYERKGSKPLDRDQKLDLFRLMRASKALADRGDYIEYANLAFEAGLPYETRAIISEGRATGKVPAADTTAAQLMTEADRSIKADAPLATIEKQAQTAASGKSILSAANVFLANGDYAKAATLYRAAIAKGGVDASEANLRLGQALSLSGDKAGSQAAFGAVTSAPRNEIAAFWTQWIELQPSMTASAG